MDGMGFYASGRTALARTAKALLHSLGYDLVPHARNAPARLPADFSPSDVETWRAVHPFTMTSPERIHALCEAVRYIVRSQIPGSIVECGVWRGGSMMAAGRTLLEMGSRNYHLYLFDTFEGMTAPSHHDLDHAGYRAIDLLLKADTDSGVRAYSSEDQTARAVHSVGYPRDQIHFVKGPVESTIPAFAPPTISLLRLDTDWYESTLHELRHLFPRLSSGGVIIIDDYGHWQGARQATDEYLRDSGAKLLLNRIDYTARIAIKP